MKTRTTLWLSLFLCGATPALCHAKTLLHVSFDKVRRNGAKVEVSVDRGPAAARVTMSDSLKLVKAVKGLGVYVANRYDAMSIQDGGVIDPREGAISFWYRPLWEHEACDLQMVFFTATFEKGRIMLYSSGMNIVVWNAENKASYSNASGRVDTSTWHTAKWHFVVMNWSAPSAPTSTTATTRSTRTRSAFLDSLR